MEAGGSGVQDRPKLQYELRTSPNYSETLESPPRAGQVCSLEHLKVFNMQENVWQISKPNCLKCWLGVFADVLVFFYTLKLLLDYQFVSCGLGEHKTV